jgi:ABC-type Na+ efflux pump permease subunit
MNKICQIAVREFVATVFTKGFIIGLLIVPVIGGILALAGPRLFGDRTFKVEGEIAVIDATGVVLPRVRAAMTQRRQPTGVGEIIDRARDGDPDEIVRGMLAATTDLTLVERPASAEVEREKLWLNEPASGARHLALVVVHTDAIQPAPGASQLGSFDLFVPPKTDDRVEAVVQGLLRDAIVEARAGVGAGFWGELSRGV